MARHLGIDPGDRRIGVAVSDPLGSMALPLATVEGRDPRRAAAEIARHVAHYEARTIVVGWPVEMDGTEGRATRRVARFIEHLEGALRRANLEEVTIHRWDERLTTTAAEALLIAADVSRKQRKQSIDQIAAAHILQGYLDALRIQAEREDEDHGDST